MSISRREAEASLAEIEQTSRLSRKLSSQVGPPLLILWGIIWMAGFSVQQFEPRFSNLAWGILDLGGGLLTWGIARRKSVVKSPHHTRTFAALLILFAYAFLWAWLLAPFNRSHLGAYIVAVVMCAYVMGGLWLGRFFIYLGLGVTLVVIIGALWIQHFESLWLALAGGGALVATGAYLGGKGERGAP
jgi:hypothetical protein